MAWPKRQLHSGNRIITCWRKSSKNTLMIREKSIIRQIIILGVINVFVVRRTLKLSFPEETTMENNKPVVSFAAGEAVWLCGRTRARPGMVRSLIITR